MGSALLLVNVASRWGLTPQYAKLEALQRQLGGGGLQVLGLPVQPVWRPGAGTAEEIEQLRSTPVRAVDLT